MIEKALMVHTKNGSNSESIFITIPNYFCSINDLIISKYGTRYTVQLLVNYHT